MFFDVTLEGWNWKKGSPLDSAALMIAEHHGRQLLLLFLSPGCAGSSDTSAFGIKPIGAMKASLRSRHN